MCGSTISKRWRALRAKCHHLALVGGALATIFSGAAHGQIVAQERMGEALVDLTAEELQRFLVGAK